MIGTDLFYWLSLYIHISKLGCDSFQHCLEDKALTDEKKNCHFELTSFF